MVTQSGLLGLPAELQMQITAHLVGDAKNVHHVPRLLNLALTCRHLARVAHEALCLAPVLQSSKVHLLLRYLFKYPELAKKIKNLTIETKETRKDKAYPVHIAHLEPDMLGHCKRHVRTLPVQKYIQDNMIASLKSERFEDHGILLGLLLTMLPQLEQLYLGSSILLNFPLFRNMIPNETDTDWTKPDWADGPDLTWVMSLIGPKLTSLELPIDLRRTPEANIWMPLSISQLPKYFPNLRWLSIPHMAATEITKTSCSDIIPPHLETLVLTDARCNCFKSFSEGLVDHGDQIALFPRLSKIALYHRYPVTPTDEAATKALADVGIKVFEYIPDCCLRSGDEFYHPWKYTPAEIGALEDCRHTEYATEWDRAALQCDSDDDD
ncbi:hypothetical protein BU25DRAFT_418270 [Macroventuria anomochaeta]|uniref:Uncharacterized protein n=1 Tax=Macroventuria anomochaeta TaxID=301207 RepID=A0ACB6SB08_9PLEO|nr:uncharacterized protein BU25DRAFT_418270 [Macroventuria anomochaeta]KAF2631476.1 hypothetical protein BU25DRAFT_418270 [Macroventuria anomochaeta]